MTGPIAELWRKIVPETPRGWSLIHTKQDGAAFLNPGTGLIVIVSCATEQDGEAWLHVSMSYDRKLPSYKDMIIVKRAFIGDDKTAIQVFPQKNKHVNYHPYCLHLWHCITRDTVPDFTQGGSMI